MDKWGLRMYDFNIYSGVKNESDPETFNSFNQIIAWELKNGLEQLGLDCNFVGMAQFKTGVIPMAKHSIVTAAAVTVNFRQNPKLLEKVKAATKGRLCMYLDADLRGYEEMYDRIFTVVPPLGDAPPQFIYCGWAADPERFYPDQSKPALFMDTFVDTPKHKICKAVYRIYDEIVEETKLEVIRPFKYYNRSDRIPWPDHAALLRRSTFYCCTVNGESGLPRIEAATSGALLVVPTILFRARTMAKLECRIWETKDELLDILSSKPDHQAIRAKAMKQTWTQVAMRIIGAIP